MLFDSRDESETRIPYQRIRQFVYKIIRRRIPNSEDAEDIAQNVLLRGWKSNERNSERLKFETEEDFLKYFSVIAFNEVKRFQSAQLKRVGMHESEELLLHIPANKLSPDHCLEIIEAICGLPLKQRLTLILGQRGLLSSLQEVFSTKSIAEMLELHYSLLEKLAEDIPLSDEGVKLVFETITENKLRTSVRDERWKARKVLRAILFRD